MGCSQKACGSLLLTFITAITDCLSFGVLTLADLSFYTTYLPRFPV